MKTIIKNFPTYEIYDDGTVINTKTQRVLNGSIGKHGYKYFRLSDGNKKTMKYCHRLVAEAFLNNPNNLPVVNHKDGNKLNNNLSNLEWTTYSDNIKHFHTSIKGNKKNQKNEKFNGSLPDEIWVQAKNSSNYEVSSFGRIHNLKTNNILHPSDTCGYYKVRLSENGKTTDWLVHKLVFFSFNNIEDIQNYCIDHIDGNKHNNHLDNLRQITLSENVNNAYYTQQTNSNVRPVVQYDKEGNLLKTFISAREAGRQLNLDSSSIIKCCKGKLKTTGGFIFHYA